MTGKKVIALVVAGLAAWFLFSYAAGKTGQSYIEGLAWTSPSLLELSGLLQIVAFTFVLAGGAGMWKVLIFLIRCAREGEGTVIIWCALVFLLIPWILLYQVAAWIFWNQHDLVYACVYAGIC